MKGTELQILNKSIDLIQGMNLGDNPSLEDIKKVLKEINNKKEIDKVNFEKSFDELIGKTFLHCENKYMGDMFDIFEVRSVIGFEEVMSDNGYEKACTLGIAYKARFMFGSFSTNKHNKFDEQLFTIKEIKNFKLVEENDLNEFINLHKIQSDNTKNFLKRVKKYIK